MYSSLFFFGNYTQAVFKIMKEILRVIMRVSINTSNYNIFTPFIFNFNPRAFVFWGVYIKISSQSSQGFCLRER